MGQLMIKCPSTGKYMPLGIQMDAGSFASSMFRGNKSQCPYCGEMHDWGMAEVRLLEEMKEES